MLSKAADESMLRLVATLRTTESGSGAFLGLASDGKQYWVKSPNNLQGPRTLIVESIVYEIGDLIGAPVCGHSLIEIPETLHFQFAGGRYLHGGIGHASLNVEDVLLAEDWTAYTHLDSNRERQAVLLALWDLCLGTDGQWLHQLTHDSTIWSFDHGMWFGGEADWTVEALEHIGTRPWLHDVSSTRLSKNALLATANRLDELSRADFAEVTARVPLDWGTTPAEMSDVADILFVRAEAVSGRLRSFASETPGH